MDADHLAELAFSAFFRIGLQFPPPLNKMFTFPQRICFYFFIFLTWNQIIYFTILRMTTMELEASLYPLATDSISSIMSHSAKATPRMSRPADVR
jgi:hypothetical protein